MKKIFTNTTCLSKKSIRNYVNDSVSPSDRFAIENHLLDCPLCSDAVDGFRQHPNELNDSPEFNLSGTKSTTTNKPTKIDLFSWVKVAAAILLIGSIGGGYYWQSTKTDRLITEHFSSTTLLPANSVLRSGGNQKNTMTPLLKKGVTLILEENYKSALEVFNKVILNTPNNTEANYYLGFSAFKTNNWSVAKEHLTYSRSNSYYQSYADWYLVAIDLQDNRQDLAKKRLEDISKDSNSPFQERAKQLLTEL